MQRKRTITTTGISNSAITPEAPFEQAAMISAILLKLIPHLCRQIFRLGRNCLLIWHRFPNRKKTLLGWFRTFGVLNKIATDGGLLFNGFE